VSSALGAAGWVRAACEVSVGGGGEAFLHAVTEVNRNAPRRSRKRSEYVLIVIVCDSSVTGKCSKNRKQAGALPYHGPPMPTTPSLSDYPETARIDWFAWLAKPSPDAT